MTLPLLVSLPHAGLWVPPEVQHSCRLTTDEIARDGDEGAAEIYDLGEHVAEFITSKVARAIVDLNRAEEDRRADGIVKTHTCWDVPVYDEFPPADVIDALLDQYYRPYHARLTELAQKGNTRLAVDCHTMAAVGPPIAPDTGETRPSVCLGDAGGVTLPFGWMDKLLGCFQAAFGPDVTVNKPFSGGYITRTHGREMPWVQVELSRGPFASNEEKRARVLQALTEFCQAELGT